MKCVICNNNEGTEYGRAGGSKPFTAVVCLGCLCDLIYEKVKK